MLVMSTIYLLIDYPPPPTFPSDNQVLPPPPPQPSPFLEHIIIHHYGRKTQLVNLSLSFYKENIGHISHVQLNIPP